MTRQQVAANMTDSLCGCEGEKSMKVRIRTATADHAPEVATIAFKALSMRIDADSPRVQRILEDGNTFVAIVEGQVAGLVSNFITCDAQGGRRFELDLLGVAPAWQGRGIGALLVERSLQAASEAGAITLRALVRRDNKPMQRTCSRTGLQRSAQIYQLWASQAGLPLIKRGRNAAAGIIPVDTLSYSGYWLEGALSQSIIDETRALLRENTERAQMGAVVPECDRATIELLRANSFDRIGDFHWWTLRPGSAQS